MSEAEYPLEKLEQFVQLLHAVERVKRVARRPDESEYTNTAEHTFELVMLCWYLHSIHKSELSLEKVLQYALAHDVVEAYAGDTYAYDEEARKTKVDREAKALIRLENEFPEFTEMLEILREYEKRETPEAKFVYAVDKLIDPLNASLETRSGYWKDHGVSFDTFFNHKTEKVKQHPIPAKYWEPLVAKLLKNKGFFFSE